MRASLFLSSLALASCAPPVAPVAPPPAAGDATVRTDPAAPGRPQVSPDGRVYTCAADPASPTKGVWSVFGNADIPDAPPDCQPGSAESRFYDPGAAPATAVGAATPPCALGWLGLVPGDHPTPFAGMVAEANRAVLAGSTAIVVHSRGDGGTYRIELTDETHARNAAGRGCRDRVHDLHGAFFTCGAGLDAQGAASGAWVRTVVPLSALRQEGWGIPAALVVGEAVKVQVTTRQADQPFRCEIALEAQPGAAAAPAVVAAAPAPAASPVPAGGPSAPTSAARAPLPPAPAAVPSRLR